MANHPSALKRHRQSLKRRDANRSVKSRLHTLVRRVNEAILAEDGDTARSGLGDASKAMAKAASKGVLPRNTASRRTSRLAKRVAKLATSSDAAN